MPCLFGPSCVGGVQAIPSIFYQSVPLIWLYFTLRVCLRRTLHIDDGYKAKVLLLLPLAVQHRDTPSSQYVRYMSYLGTQEADYIPIVLLSPSPQSANLS